jgi:hypothetical protein
MAQHVITDIRTANPDQTLLNLRPQILFFALKDPDSAKILGEIISINGRKSFEPNNNTATMLLYLLASDDDDAMLLRTFLDLVMAKYSGVTTDDVYTFLEKLDNQKILQKRTGTASSADPDPLDLFNPPQVAWDPDPDVTQGPKSPICKTRTFHSINAGYVRIPR